MNIEIRLRPSTGSRRLKIDVDQFRRLKQAGAFADYSKVELLDGAMSGVPRQNEDEAESDASVTIKLRVSDYVLLDDAGLLVEPGRTELIDGIIYVMSPQHRPHWFVKNELTYRLRRALELADAALYAGSEGSVLVSEHDLPEPDIIVTDDPIGLGPIPLASVRLIVEVSASTHDLDSGPKAGLYAAHAVPEYWIVDVAGRVIHRRHAVGAGTYTISDAVPFGAPISAATIPGLAIETVGL